MFLPFFYALRESSLRVSLTEWLMLLEALELGLHDSTLSGFYWLCRSVLVKDESKYDEFDQVFFTCFQPGEDEAAETSRLLQKWLTEPSFRRRELERLAQATSRSPEEIEALFAQRLREQKKEHNGGSRWIGTGGDTPFGSHGRRPGGIRMAGASELHSAYRLAGVRKYRDWRQDASLGPRQFQTAFRALRQLTRNTGAAKTELDVDATIRATCDQGGLLRVRYTSPRRNAIRLLLLMDSGGSMEEYSRLCSMLFQAVGKSGHFQDLKIYYFHNCPYSRLYTQPTLDPRDTFSTRQLLRTLPSEYRLIIVGDGQMDPDELLAKGPSLDGMPPMSGLDWLLALKRQYLKTIWLHPQQPPQSSGYWTETFECISRQFPMYPITVEGLQRGMRKLMDSHSRNA